MNIYMKKIMSKKTSIFAISALFIVIPLFVLAGATPSPSPSASPATPAIGSSSSSAGQSAPSTGSSGSSAGQSAPGTGSSGSSAGTNPPSTGGSSSSAGQGTPSTGGSGSSTGTNPPSTGGSGSSTGTPSPTPTPIPTTSPSPTTTPSPTTSPAPTGNSNSGGGLGGNFAAGGFFYGGTVSSAAVNLALESTTTASSTQMNSATSTTITTCNLLQAYIKSGANNPPAEVIKLQTFLSDIEHANININGIYDAETFAAVMAFQKKYQNTILGPWGTTIPTGYVYITTLKNVNKLACNVPLTFTQNDLAIINGVRGNLAFKSNILPVNGSKVSIPINSSAAIDASNTNTFVSQNNAVQNTANATNASFAHRLQNFIHAIMNF